VRPNASLGRVLDDLGATLLELVHGDPDQTAAIGGVVIHDPLDEPALPQHALVLGVGVGDAAAIARLLRTLGQQEAAGLVIRSPVPASDTLAAAVAESGVALLALARGASWAQLAALLRSLLAEGDVGEAEPQTLGGVPAGDLFALANAIAALLDAPVTIEDRSSRVLAYSGRQDEADPSRIETILGRQVPARYARQLTDRGVFGDLYRSDQPVFVEPSGDDFLVPRVAVAVRAGDEVLGSIWAAVRQPLNLDRMQAFRDAARVVALHMLRIRAGADVERRLRADLLSTALEGGPAARDALNRLGLADRPVAVLGLALLGAEGSAAADAGLATERQQLADALAMHIGAAHPRSAAALVGDVVYGLIPITRGRGDGEQSAVRIATDFLDRVGERIPAVAGIGSVAQDVAGLAAARAEADRALRVLRTGNSAGRRVARLTDVHVEALLLDLADVVSARGDQPSGAVANLLAYDAAHSTNLVDTLRTWLDAFGDAVAAAAAMYVHPNTFRYRLRRVAEIGPVDLRDPDARFAAMLELRLLPRRTD
jgi:DNA-binding PucR family transcriptional regulator